MENIENIKALVDALTSICANIDRKKDSFMTPLQVRAMEETLYKISGIKVQITDIGWFKRELEYYKNKLRVYQQVNESKQISDTEEHELPIDTLVVYTNNIEYWSIGIYKGNRRVSSKIVGF